MCIPQCLYVHARANNEHLQLLLPLVCTTLRIHDVIDNLFFIAQISSDENKHGPEDTDISQKGSGHLTPDI